jgi:hypothetical protein
VAKAKKEGLLKKITRRLSRKKLLEPPIGPAVSSDTTRIIVETAKAALYEEEPEIPEEFQPPPHSDKVTVTSYRAHGKEFVHVVFADSNRFVKEGTILRKDPISRKYTRVPKGPRQSSYYRDGVLND